MSEFDLVFERLLDNISEKRYINSQFVDNLRLLIKALAESDFLNKNISVEQTIQSTLQQPNNVKTIVLNTEEQSMPPIKLLVKQEVGTEAFSVTVVNVKEPSKQKEFKNSMLETIFEDVIDYIKSITLQQISPDSAVEQLPKTEGPAQQSGNTDSALPSSEKSI